MVGNSQHGLIKEKMCLINLVAFSDELTESVDVRTVVDVVHLDFCKN